MFRLILVTFAAASLAVAGPAVKKCASSDSKCIKQSATALIPMFVKGIPEYGVEPTDPVFLKEIDASTPSLKFTVRDFTIVGVSSCKLKKIQRDVSKSQMYVRLQCDLEGDGLYTMKGQLLVLPIEGEGKVHIKIHKAALNADLDMDTKTGPDGKKYWVIKDWRYSYDLKEKSELVFENLFEKSEVLRSAANDLIANNSNEIVKEIGGPIINALVGKIVNSVKAFFDHVPYDDLSID